jgi:sigma-B regulation protein RsbU (phosphoserine phosphatase)
MDSEDDTPATHSIQLHTGDLVFCMTDGVTEAIAPDGTLFGVERALEVVRANRRKRAHEIVDALMCAVRAYVQGHTQTDDITTVIVKVEPER